MIGTAPSALMAASGNLGEAAKKAQFRPMLQKEEKLWTKHTLDNHAIVHQSEVVSEQSPAMPIYLTNAASGMTRTANTEAHKGK